MKAIVTLRLPKVLSHDPSHKRTGKCPIRCIGQCTDQTGEHHSLLVFGQDLEKIKQKVEKMFDFHITRIEEVLEEF